MNKQDYEILSSLVEDVCESDEQTDALVRLFGTVKQMLKDYRHQY